MPPPQFHIADIALVSSEGADTGGYMIIPLIPNGDTTTKVYPIYSRRKIDNAAANLPKVLNEVIRLTTSVGGLDKLHDSVVLNKLPRRSNLQSTIPRNQTQLLSNMTGLIKCKPCPKLAKIAMHTAGDHCKQSNTQNKSEKQVVPKHSLKICCGSCMTKIDPDFRYCPSCGVPRRTSLMPGEDNNSSKRLANKPLNLRTKCYKCSHIFSKYNMKYHAATCQGKRKSKETSPPSCKERVTITKTLQNVNEEEGYHDEIGQLKCVTESSSSSEPIKSSGTYQINELSDKSSEDSQGPLFECPNCMRTFLAKSLAVHRRSCGHTLNFRRVLIKDDNPTTTILSSLKKRSKKNRWRP